MLRPILTIACLVGVTTAVLAQADPIEARRNMMKAVGAQTRIGTQMAKGEIPFDAAKAQEVLRVYGEAAAKTPALFPATAKEGGGTTAAPAIWENKADFEGKFKAWGDAVQKASASVGTLDGFKAAFGELTKSCGGCHQTYRQKT